MDNPAFIIRVKALMYAPSGAFDALNSKYIDYMKKPIAPQGLVESNTIARFLENKKESVPQDRVNSLARTVPGADVRDLHSSTMEWKNLWLSPNEWNCHQDHVSVASRYPGVYLGSAYEACFHWSSQPPSGPLTILISVLENFSNDLANVRPISCAGSPVHHQHH